MSSFVGMTEERQMLSSRLESEAADLKLLSKSLVLVEGSS